MAEYVKIENCPQYVKDTSSGAILNTDNNALSAYRTRKKMMKSIHTNEDRLTSLEAQMSRIEQLLLKVLEK